MSIILKPTLLIGVTLAGAVPMSRPGPARGPRADTKVTILLLNGKNGRPMKRTLLNITVFPRMPKHNPPGPAWAGWQGARALYPKTDRNGEATIHAPRNGAVEAFAGGYDVGCRPPFPNSEYPKYPRPGDVALYPVARILSRGTVSENSCGKGHAVPVPGRLVIFARPMTFWERMGT